MMRFGDKKAPISFMLLLISDITNSDMTKTLD